MIDIVDPRTGELMDTDSVPGLAQVAAMLVDQINELAAVVEDDGSPRAEGKAPFVWTDLDPRAATRAWRQLARWVAWLRGRYPLARQVPLCWWRHPELVEELTALWFAWREAYTEKNAPLTAAADWHGRWLPEFLRRIGAGGWNVACEGEHKDRVVGLYDARAVDDEHDFEAFIASSPTQETEPFNETEEHVDADEMTRALERGAARSVGDLPGSPVAYLDGYWLQADDGSWERIEDPETVAYLGDAERRLRLADKAVEDGEQP